MLEQVNVVFAPDEVKIRPLVLITQAEEWKAAIQWHQFNNFSKLVNTRAYGQREMSKHQPVKTLARIEERESQQIYSTYRSKTIWRTKELPQSKKWTFN